MGQTKGGGGEENIRQRFLPASPFVSFPVDFMMAAAIKVPLSRAFSKQQQLLCRRRLYDAISSLVFHKSL